MALTWLKRRPGRRAAGVRRSLIAGLAAAFAGFTLAGAPARGEEAGIGVELNRLQDVKDACRISLVFTNNLEKPVQELSIEIVLFNADGAVERFLVLKSNPLPEGKIRVQQFDAEGLGCKTVGKVLLNDVPACRVEGVERGACLEAIRPSSRTGVDFFAKTSAGADSGAGKDGQP